MYIYKICKLESLEVMAEVVLRDYVMYIYRKKYTHTLPAIDVPDIVGPFFSAEDTLHRVFESYITTHTLQAIDAPNIGRVLLF